MKFDFKKIKVIGIMALITVFLFIMISVLFPKKEDDSIELKLNGEETITIKQYEEYKESGALATSKKDGDISNKIAIDGIVNTSLVGTYVITYRITDDHNNEYKLSRTVNVIADNNNSEIASYTISNSTYTKDAITINVSVKINNYKYTVLPSLLKTFAKEVKYDVKSNGKYTFTIYDTNGKSYKYDVNVANIDSTQPIITCKALIENDKITVTVNATDNGSGIAGYSYAFNGNYSDYISANRYVYNGISEVVYVRAKDNAGNIKVTDCEMENNTIEEPSVIIPTGLVPCNNPNRTAQEAELNRRINAAGKRTKGSVLAAAKYLATDFGYHLPYYFGGGHGLYGEGSLIGISPYWGCPVVNGKASLTSNVEENKHPYSLDCSGYVAWAFLNAGFTENEINRYASTQADNKWNGIRVEKVSFSSGGGKRAEPGDLVWKEGHIGFVIEVDIPNNRIRLAHEAGGGRGLIIEYHNLSNGKSLESERYFTHVVLMKNFFNGTH
jgi:hypothetical protein